MADHEETAHLNERTLRQEGCRHGHNVRICAPVGYARRGCNDDLPVFHAASQSRSRLIHLPAASSAPKSVAFPKIPRAAGDFIKSSHAFAASGCAASATSAPA